MPRLIRSAVLSNYIEVARSVGLDPYRMIAEYRLPPACLTDPEVKVSAGAVGRLLEASAERSGKSDFGLRLADQRTMANLGALALLVREQPTIRKAIDVLVGYMFLHSESLLLNTREEGGDLILTLAIGVDRPVPIRQGVELGVGFLHRSFQRLFRERWKPQTVCFTHRAPAKKDVYRKFFGTDVLFNQDFNGIVCAARDIDVAVPAADAKMTQYLQQYLDTLAERPSSSMSASVRECIYTMLPSGLCSAGSVAARLGVDRRTVHRHLEREGKTFSAIMDSVRAELVTRYVANRDRPLVSVAELLGFSALSAFSRWFRNQFGCSVSEWRAGRPATRAKLARANPQTAASRAQPQEPVPSMRKPNILAWYPRPMGAVLADGSSKPDHDGLEARVQVFQSVRTWRVHQEIKKNPLRASVGGRSLEAR